MPIPQRATDIVAPDALISAAQTLEAAQEIAVDIEADQMHHFRARLCFVQLGSDEDIFLVDTLAPGVTPTPLGPLLGNPARTKFFHAAGGDLAYLASAGIRVQGLFDTHRAATLLGWPKIGLADLVLEHLKVQLKKDHQQSDFSLRPLPPGMRDYIADDVRYLVDLGRLVQKACVDADIVEEVSLDCLRMTEEAKPLAETGGEFRPKIAKQGLSAAQVRLAEFLAHRLNAARLTWAEAEDLPFGRMLSNAAIGAIAVKPPQSLGELKKLEGVRGGFLRTHGEACLGLIQDAMADFAREDTQSAVPAPKPDPRIRKREDRLGDFRKAKALERKVTPSVVLTTAQVAELSKNPPASLEALAALPYFGQKRTRLYGEALLTLLRGVE